MNKTKNIYIIIVILVSIALIVGISIKILDTTGKINQGNFRVNDAVITSTIDVSEKENTQDKTDENTKTITETNTETGEQVVTDENKEEGLKKLSFTLSQKNTIALLITKETQVKEMYINNISSTLPVKKGEFIMYINDTQEKISLENNTSKINVIPQEKDSQYYIEFKINNDEFASDLVLPESTNKITFDGTILKVLDLKLSDIVFGVKFDLNIIDSTGKLNVCKFDFKLPFEELATEGVSITRQETSRYIFSIRQNDEK
jgi:hypothetical protein